MLKEELEEVLKKENIEAAQNMVTTKILISFEDQMETILPF